MTQRYCGRLTVLALAVAVLVGPSGVDPSGGALAAQSGSASTASRKASGENSDRDHAVVKESGSRPVQESASPSAQAIDSRRNVAGTARGDDGVRAGDPTKTRPSPWHRAAPGQETPVGRAAGSTARVKRDLGTPQVALTFDDGPDSATPHLLALLRKAGVKATFCVIGINARRHPDLIRQIVADGHTLCNHTWSHDLRLGSKPVDVIRGDLQRTTNEIHHIVPNAPLRYFRHPGGNFTAASTRVANQLGMISLGWNVDPRDWDLTQHGRGAPLADHIVNVVTKQCKAGSIVLSHDGGSDRSGTLLAYQRLLPWLTARHDLVALPS